MKRVLLIGLCLWWASVALAQDEAGSLLTRINNLRGAKGLPAYTINGALSAAAQQQAQWIVDHGSVAHVHPDGSSPQSRAAAAGYGSPYVGENIYGGTNASTNDAWVFWINSGIHYAGLVNVHYKEIGIGAAHGSWGAAYVLLFGDPGGPEYIPPADGSGGKQAAVRRPPAYVLGLDEHGNIKHQVQPGDTLGQIALLYGYTWDDIPAMLALNNLSAQDARNLEVGSVFLVPPKAGTYTPTPGEEIASAPTEAATRTPESASPTPGPSSTVEDLGIITTPGPAPDIGTPPGIITVVSLPQSVAMLMPTGTATASLVPTATPAVVQQSVSPVIAPAGPSPWLTVALVVQVGVLLGAGFEFIRRVRRR
jgi:LysM repeat protein